MAHGILRITYKLVREGLEYDESIYAKIEAENRKNRFHRLEANAKTLGYRLLPPDPTCVQNEAPASSLPDEGSTFVLAARPRGLPYIAPLGLMLTPASPLPHPCLTPASPLPPHP